MIELLEVGFRPRRVATLFAIQPPVVYHRRRRFEALGLLGLTTRPRSGTPITIRVPVQVIMKVFQRLDNNPLLGHYRVKMALDSLGYGASQKQTQGDKHAAGVRILVAGQPSCSRAKMFLRIQHDHWYVIGLIEFSQSP